MAASRTTFETSKSGPLVCDILGQLDDAKAVILTVHDLGCNSSSWANFVNHPSMSEVTKRATWVHVNLPGHEDGAADLPKDCKFPSLDELAAAIGEVTEKVHCPVIGLGEGAGANILARLALSPQKKLHGAILIHCTSTSAGFLESLQDKMINFKLLGGMNPSAENYLIMHRFGDFTHAENMDQVKAVVDAFHEQLNKTMNAKNIRGYIDAFVHRTSIAEKMGALSVPVLLITGAKASHNHTVHTLYNATIRSVTDRKLVEFVEVVDVANVVEGAPSKLAESLIYFSQGCGVLGAVPMPHLGSQTRSDTTMEALDKSDM